MVALCMGALNVYGSFAAPGPGAGAAQHRHDRLPGWPPRRSLERPVIGLALGVLVGGAAQLALQLPFLAAPPAAVPGGRARACHPALARMARLMVPAVLGGAVYQINILVGHPARLAAAGRQRELPLLRGPAGGVSAGGGRHGRPRRRCCRAWRARRRPGDAPALRATFGYAFRLVSFAHAAGDGRADPAGRADRGAAVPARRVQRRIDVRLTAQALSYYALGLWAFSAVRIAVAAFFALQDSRTPVRAATVSILANLLLGAVLHAPAGPRRDGAGDLAGLDSEPGAAAAGGLQRRLGGMRLARDRRLARRARCSARLVMAAGRVAFSRGR
ncbi:MAG: hypothetical protein MZV70_08505 [Desulfobacterales bacterium]|nr:hypothetical protein [Desulfobacterales bacterium]